MKKGKNIINMVSHKVYDSLKFNKDFNPTYKEYKQVIKAVNKLRCQDVVNSPEGHQLPLKLGTLIILAGKPRVSKLYSMTQPGKRITNLHSFGIIYKCFHKNPLNLRHPKLYKWRSHRANIKVPLYNIIMESKQAYYSQEEFHIHK